MQIVVLESLSGPLSLPPVWLDHLHQLLFPLLELHEHQLVLLGGVVLIRLRVQAAPLIVVLDRVDSDLGAGHRHQVGVLLQFRILICVTLKVAVLRDSDLLVMTSLANVPLVHGAEWLQGCLGYVVIHASRRVDGGLVSDCFNVIDLDPLLLRHLPVKRFS